MFILFLVNFDTISLYVCYKINIVRNKAQYSVLDLPGDRREEHIRFSKLIYELFQVPFSSSKSSWFKICRVGWKGQNWHCSDYSLPKHNTGK